MEFDIVKVLLGMTLFGAEWVLWLLLFLSVLSISIIIERFFYFLKIRISFTDFTLQLSDFLASKDIKGAQEFCKKSETLEAKVALEGLNNFSKGSVSIESRMEGFAVGYKQKLDRWLVVLGTLGNNAPFIGLFGTVIGIIKAFNDLASNPDGDLPLLWPVFQKLL